MGSERWSKSPLLAPGTREKWGTHGDVESARRTKVVNKWDEWCEYSADKRLESMIFLESYQGGVDFSNIQAGLLFWFGRLAFRTRFLSASVRKQQVPHRLSEPVRNDIGKPLP
jgi:hypothetical protein